MRERALILVRNAGFGLSILTALLLGTAGPAQAQGRQAPHHPSIEDYVRHLTDQMKEAEDHDPGSARVVHLARSWFVAMVIGSIVVVAGIVLALFSSVWLRSNATTDPEKLAKSDPWVRAYLAQQQAAKAAESTSTAEVKA